MTIVNKGAKNIMDPNWIVAIVATVYTVITGWLIIEQRKSRLDDKFPCIVVRCLYGPGITTFEKQWTLRLVNIGRGPAFIKHFYTEGVPYIADGVHTDDIDNVIGPEVGDPDLQISFAPTNHPSTFQQSPWTIIIRYLDIAGRMFESGIKEGKPFYKPPW